MRAARRAELDEVAGRFDRWRSRRPTREIPRELWLAAWRLVGPYTVTRVCQRLRLNATRFKLMGGRLAAAGIKPERRVASRAAWRGPSSGGATFVELAPIGLTGPGMVAGANAEGGQGGCRLVVESARGTRVTIALERMNVAVIDGVCRLVLGEADRRAQA